METQQAFLRSIQYENGSLQILDQTKIPFEMEMFPIRNCKDAWLAIKEMKVRGAPAIAIVGCLSLAVELRESTISESIDDYVRDRLDYLITSRPTAVNLQKASDELKRRMKTEWNDKDIKTEVIRWCENLLRTDLNDNLLIGEYGAREIGRNDQRRILTCCNTGSLATSGYGTALGVIRSLHSMKKLECAYYVETRPYNQGIRLTGFELNQDAIPCELICDNMVGLLFAKKGISAVVVGADRVAANGDFANKIGTYQIAVLAKYHGVPFYTAVPFTSIDPKTKTGEEIVIEERSKDEIIKCPCKNKQLLCSSDTKAWNPAFDVTPAELITGGIITERGVYKYPFEFQVETYLLGQHS